MKGRAFVRHPVIMPWVIVFVLLQSLDILTTAIGASTVPLFIVESNPIMRGVAWVDGWRGVIAIKALICLGTVIFLTALPFRRTARVVLIGLILAQGVVVALNVAQLIRGP